MKSFVSVVSFAALALVAQGAMFKYNAYQFKSRNLCLNTAGPNGPYASATGYGGLVLSTSCRASFLSTNPRGTYRPGVVPKANEQFGAIFFGTDNEGTQFNSFFCAVTPSKSGNPKAVFDLVRLDANNGGNMVDCSAVQFKLDGDVVNVKRDMDRDRQLCLYAGPNVFAADCSLPGAKVTFSNPSRVISWDTANLGSNALRFFYFIM